MLQDRGRREAGFDRRATHDSSTSAPAQRHGESGPTGPSHSTRAAAVGSVPGGAARQEPTVRECAPARHGTAAGARRLRQRRRLARRTRRHRRRRRRHPPRHRREAPRSRSRRQRRRQDSRRPARPDSRASAPGPRCSASAHRAAGAACSTRRHARAGTASRRGQSVRSTATPLLSAGCPHHG
jgi:hypothetical protein